MWRTIQGYKATHMLRKGQHDRLAKRDVLTQNHVINQLCGFAAREGSPSLSSNSKQLLPHDLARPSYGACRLL